MLDPIKILKNAIQKQAKSEKAVLVLFHAIHYLEYTEIYEKYYSNTTRLTEDYSWYESKEE